MLSGSNFSRNLHFPKLMISDETNDPTTDNQSFALNFPQLHALPELTPPSPHGKVNFPAAATALTNGKQGPFNQTPLLHQGGYLPSLETRTPPSSSISSSPSDYTVPTTVRSYSFSGGYIQSGRSLSPPTPPTSTTKEFPLIALHATATSCSSTESEPFYQTNMSSYTSDHSGRQQQPARPHLNFERSPHLPHMQDHELYAQGSSGLMTPPTQLGTPPGSSRANSTELDYRTPQSAYPPATMSPGYYTEAPNHNFDNMQYHQQSPTRHSASGRSPGRFLGIQRFSCLRPMLMPVKVGRSPKFQRASSPYLYTPYGLERRQSVPSIYQLETSPFLSSGLPWPSSVPRRSTEHLPQLHTSSPSVPFPSYLNTPPTNRFGDSPWLGQRERSYSDEGILSSGNVYRCNKCRYIGGSSEQLQKHQQKHLKSHKCRFPQCSRTEGFATPNDRERHEKSIHKIPGRLLAEDNPPARQRLIV